MECRAAPLSASAHQYAPHPESGCDPTGVTRRTCTSDPRATGSVLSCSIHTTASEMHARSRSHTRALTLTLMRTHSHPPSSRSATAETPPLDEVCGGQYPSTAWCAWCVVEPTHPVCSCTDELEHRPGHQLLALYSHELHVARKQLGSAQSVRSVRTSDRASAPRSRVESRKRACWGGTACQGRERRAGPDCASSQRTRCVPS